MYIDTLARLNAAIAFKSSDEDSREKVCLDSRVIIPLRN